MKREIYHFVFVLIIVLTSSCAYDNYEKPQVKLTGKLVYNGVPLNVSYNDVQFQLWEPGWQKSHPIDVTVDQDGSYSALLFAGTYKLVIPAWQGPFIASKIAGESDTLVVQLDGNKNLDIEVIPYYMINNSSISATGRTVTGSFGLEKIATGSDARAVERVNLYISKTQFVDNRTSVATAEVMAGDIVDFNNISLSTDVPELTPSQGYVFARIGVKISGVEDMLFSSVERITL